MKGIISSILCNSALNFQFQRICIQLPQSASGREDGGAGQVCPPPLRPGLSPLLSPLGTEPSQLYTIYNLSSHNNKDIYILNLLHFVRKILFSHSTRAQGNCFLYILYEFNYSDIQFLVGKRPNSKDLFLRSLPLQGGSLSSLRFNFQIPGNMKLRYNQVLFSRSRMLHLNQSQSTKKITSALR